MQGIATSTMFALKKKISRFALILHSELQFCQARNDTCDPETESKHRAQGNTLRHWFMPLTFSMQNKGPNVEQVTQYVCRQY